MELGALSGSVGYPGKVYGDPVAKTLHSQCRGPGFDPWSGKSVPHTATRSVCAATEGAGCSNEDLERHEDPGH